MYIILDNKKEKFITQIKFVPTDHGLNPNVEKEIENSNVYAKIYGCDERIENFDSFNNTDTAGM